MISFQARVTINRHWQNIKLKITNFFFLFCPKLPDVMRLFFDFYMLKPYRFSWWFKFL
jgi:hypothetical protein